jgi:hypothetical protein
MYSNRKSFIRYPSRSSINLKKKGSAVSMPASRTIPVQNFHLNEEIFHADDHFGLRSGGKIRSVPSGLKGSFEMVFLLKLSALKV